MLKQIYDLINQAVSGGKLTVIPIGASALTTTLVNGAAINNIPTGLNAFSTLNFDWLNLQVTNTGNSPLNSFAVQVKFATAGDWQTIYSQSTDFVTPPLDSTLKSASGDLTLLPAGANGWLTLDVTYYAQIRLLVSAATSTLLNVIAEAKTKVNLEGG